MKSTRISIDALERQLATLAALVDEIAPPPIVTPDEAEAVRQYLLAYARGQADEFWRRETRSAALVATVVARGMACDEREASGELSGGSWVSGCECS
jgi:hypothetical protein